uniref:Protein kinase domain-containing protein n=1 Tax=Apteryx owenii TaxID=8824 RepID=A0A8B9PKS6_APTOW
LSQLDHERIVFFHDAFEKKNAVIMVMELYPEAAPITSFGSCPMPFALPCGQYLPCLSPAGEPPAKLPSACTQVRICDFGNAQELTPDEPQYCNYGTPEFVGPEIVNQSPISSVTDVWPVGVIAYLCLTGISPFVGENDKTTLMNIRNYNVAFEERMFQGLTREAKGFVIKTLAKGKVISTDHLKLFLSRRKWQVKMGTEMGTGPCRALPACPTDAPALPCPCAPFCSPDFPPIFHIKLKDQVLLEGDALTLCCLPAGSPTPRIVWMKDKRSLQSDNVLNIVSCKDGRQMLTISKVSRKDAGLYECAAANTLGTAISSCTLAVARKDAGETLGDREEQPWASQSCHHRGLGVPAVTLVCM